MDQERPIGRLHSDKRWPSRIDDPDATDTRRPVADAEGLVIPLQEDYAALRGGGGNPFVNAGVVRTMNRKSRVGTPNAFAAFATFPHDSANTRFARSIDMFSQLEGILGVGYRDILRSRSCHGEGAGE
jgi:hypothetical protein